MSLQSKPVHHWCQQDVVNEVFTVNAILFTDGKIRSDNGNCLNIFRSVDTQRFSRFPFLFLCCKLTLLGGHEFSPLPHSNFTAPKPQMAPVDTKPNKPSCDTKLLSISHIADDT